MDERDIQKFLYYEARLMDEHLYEEWLSLWTDDALYWVPCNRDDIDPAREVSIIYDDRTRLEDRVAYLRDGTVLAPDSRPRLRRMVSNIEVENTGDAETTVFSNFSLIEAREREQRIWAGRSIHRLCEIDGHIKISNKKVLLVNNHQELPALQFLV